jgi:hypothetical protein
VSDFEAIKEACRYYSLGQEFQSDVFVHTKGTTATILAVYGGKVYQFRKSGSHWNADLQRLGLTGSVIEYVESTGNEMKRYSWRKNGLQAST